jgi:hypothetical protein
LSGITDNWSTDYHLGIQQTGISLSFQESLDAPRPVYRFLGEDGEVEQLLEVKEDVLQKALATNNVALSRREIRPN